MFIMNSKNKILSSLLFVAVCLAVSCQKMTRPAMSDYTKDTNPPGGPLKFYTAFDGADVDSIRATFGTPKNVTYTTGISGKAYKGSLNSNIVYAAANDFDKVSSFTVAFWMKKRPHDANAEFVFALPTTSGIWHKSEMFMLIEDKNQSSGDSMATKILIHDQWFEFINPTGNDDPTGRLDYRLATALNGQWHHMGIVYDATTSKLTVYVDGVPRTGLPSNRTDAKNGSAPLGPVNFKQVSKFVIGGPAHVGLGATPDGWMANYSGELDQFRMYGTALSAAEINALFTGKK
jgi:hypothetical protein